MTREELRQRYVAGGNKWEGCFGYGFWTEGLVLQQPETEIELKVLVEKLRKDDQEQRDQIGSLTLRLNHLSINHKEQARKAWDAAWLMNEATFRVRDGAFEWWYKETYGE